MKPPPANALVNKLIVLTLALLVFAGTLGLGAVWVRQEIFQTANRSRQVEIEIADVERRLDEVRAEVASALNPDALLRQNQVMRLGLVLPREEVVSRISGSPEFELASKRAGEAFTVTPRGAPAQLSFRVANDSTR